MIPLDHLWCVVIKTLYRPRRIGAVAVAMLSACAAPDATSDPGDGDAVTEAGDEAVDAAARYEPARPGDVGIGDPLFPTLGNGGYDIAHYDLELRYETAAPSQPIDGTVRILARATHSLSQLDLDFDGASIGSVRIDGRAAAFHRDGEELVITPASAIRRGEWFIITVSHFVAIPRVPSRADLLGAPFSITPDGSVWAGQPDGAHQIFPSNDHPSDKASFSFRIDVPAGTTAVASGVQTAQHTQDGRTVYRFEQREPMATELAQVAVGAFSVISRGEHAGVTVRDVVPTRLASELAPKLASVTEHLAFLEERLGDYPFRSYGSLVVESSLGFALETQTLSLYETSYFARDAAVYEPIMVHELAHQWFGDSVAPSRWADVWQNEGHATWYELTFQIAPDSTDFTELMKLIYSLGDSWRTLFGAVASPLRGDAIALFNPNVYYGGALALYALRQQIGDAAFQQVERTWVAEYRGKSASTADFIALASRISGQDLTAFLNDWLYGKTTPAMPGHPDWTVDPVEPRLAAATVPLKGLRVMRH